MYLVLALCAVLLAGCTTTSETTEHRDEAGLWQCPATEPGDCVLVEPARIDIDLRGLEEGALAS